MRKKTILRVQKLQASPSVSLEEIPEIARQLNLDTWITILVYVKL